MFPWPLYGLSLDLIDGAVGVTDDCIQERQLQSQNVMVL